MLSVHLLCRRVFSVLSLFLYPSKPFLWPKAWVACVRSHSLPKIHLMLERISVGDNTLFRHHVLDDLVLCLSSSILTQANHQSNVPKMPVCSPLENKSCLKGQRGGLRGASRVCPLQTSPTNLTNHPQCI